MTYYNLNSYCSPKPFVIVDTQQPISNGLNLKWENQTKVTTQSPSVFGPPMWFSLHTGSANLPKILSPISAKRLKNFVDGIPEMASCSSCSDHSRGYIEKNKDRIENFKYGDDVFKFYVDFHNYVNERLGKPIMSYETASKMYRDGDVKVFSYN